MKCKQNDFNGHVLQTMYTIKHKSKANIAPQRPKYKISTVLCLTKLFHHQKWFKYESLNDIKTSQIQCIEMIPNVSQLITVTYVQFSRLTKHRSALQILCRPYLCHSFALPLLFHFIFIPPKTSQSVTQISALRIK